MTRPPYIRWAVAAAIVVAALLWDLRGSAEILYPFASTAIAAGTPITDSQVVWRSIPQGVMQMPDLTDPIASRDVATGEPIVPSAVSGLSMIPEGWWSVPVPLPSMAVLGSRIRLVGIETAFETDGIVVSVAGEDLLSFSESGLVAVPPAYAAVVAIASREGALIVLLDP